MSKSIIDLNSRINDIARFAAYHDDSIVNIQLVLTALQFVQRAFPSWELKVFRDMYMDDMLRTL